MDRRFETLLAELEVEAVVDPAVLDGVVERLEGFAAPFADALATEGRRLHARQYLAGLVSKLEHKTAEAIAYQHDQDRQTLQKFIGQNPWDHRPLIDVLVRQVGAELGRRDGVIIFDPSAFPKKGSESVGVQRQWCGRLGKIDNCQVGVFMAYASDVEHALVDFRLYLPEDWARDKKRRNKCGVPKELEFQTRHELALEMLRASGSQLPHAWIAGDDEMGRSSGFREALNALGERYLLAVPSNTLVRDLESDRPTGPRGKVPFERADRWAAALPASAWTELDVRTGAKGPLTVEIVKRRVRTKSEGRTGAEEVLIVTRELQSNGSYKHDYWLSNASSDTELFEFARVAKTENRVEECFKRAKSCAGLADYQVRNWMGWHHHMTLSLVAAWFLTSECRRGKKMDVGVDGPAGAGGAGAHPSELAGLQRAGATSTDDVALAVSIPTGMALPYEGAQPIATREAAATGVVGIQ